MSDWLRRASEYERPWVGRVGLILGVLLWLLVSAAGFGAGVGTGFALLILGGALIIGEVWSDRTRGRPVAFWIGWYLAWKIGAAVAVIATGAVGSTGWSAVFAWAIAAWLIVWGVMVATLQWLATRETAVAGED